MGTWEAFHKIRKLLFDIDRKAQCHIIRYSDHTVDPPKIGIRIQMYEGRIICGKSLSMVVLEKAFQEGTFDSLIALMLAGLRRKIRNYGE